MPHTNRKKKSGAASASKGPKIVHTKRQLLDDDEGWTHVVDAKKTAKPVEVKELGHRPWEGDVISGKTAVVTMDYKEMEAEHARFKQQWEDSEACSKLKALVTEMKDSLKITNVVCLGLGSLQDWKLQMRRASHTQVAALHTILTSLGVESVQKTAQEPNATELDKQFLAALGFDNVEDPAAFEKIDEGSLVYGIHLYPGQYREVSKRPQPAVLIGNDLGQWIEKAKLNPSTFSDMTDDIERLISGYTAVDFPQIRHDFSDTRIYTKAVVEQS